MTNQAAARTQWLRCAIKSVEEVGIFPSSGIETFGASVPKRLSYFLQIDPAVQKLALYIFLRAAEHGVR